MNFFLSIIFFINNTLQNTSFFNQLTNRLSGQKIKMTYSTSNYFCVISRFKSKANFFVQIEQIRWHLLMVKQFGVDTNNKIIKPVCKINQKCPNPKWGCPIKKLMNQKDYDKYRALQKLQFLISNPLSIRNAKLRAKTDLMFRLS